MILDLPKPRAGKDDIRELVRNIYIDTARLNGALVGAEEATDPMRSSGRSRLHDLRKAGIALVRFQQPEELERLTATIAEVRWRLKTQQAARSDMVRTLEYGTNAEKAQPLDDRPEALLDEGERYLMEQNRKRGRLSRAEAAEQLGEARSANFVETPVLRKLDAALESLERALGVTASAPSEPGELGTLRKVQIGEAPKIVVPPIIVDYGLPSEVPDEAAVRRVNDDILAEYGRSAQTDTIRPPGAQIGLKRLNDDPDAPRQPDDKELIRVRGISPVKPTTKPDAGEMKVSHEVQIGGRTFTRSQTGEEPAMTLQQALERSLLAVKGAIAEQNRAKGG